MGLHKRVLIANRGEIAIRIAKAATALGMESVAVYPEADALSLHIRVASHARPIGGDRQDPIGSYLDGAALIRIAKETDCDCIHPGYGFLSENANFAAMCAAADIAFVGPGAAALELFGDKVASRALAQSCGIPVISGSPSALASVSEAREMAQNIGYPVMLKAAAGGGGRGMRAVYNEVDMVEAFERCQSEAATAFGDSAIFIERLLQRPRHIEVQILADGAGNIVHLHERDCSVQIRNQKVVEIAPAAGLADDLRQRIYDDAIKLAKAANYVNAGTVEFLVVPESGEHYFIECNPRIQVEHTVTEQITGIDLVECQFRLAAGAKLESLGLGDQTAVGPARGFAVQARVVATGTGTITRYKEPTGAGIRVDACGYLGYTPPPQFDPLLAKLICSSGSSNSLAGAVDRTLAALAEFQITELPTNLAQLATILATDELRAGDARTSFMAEHSDLDDGGTTPTGGETLAFLNQQAAALAGPSAARKPQLMTNLTQDLEVAVDATAVECPMTGSILQFSLQIGNRVAAGDTIFIISAMKMEAAVEAPCSGTVTALQDIREGDSVAAGQAVAAITPDAGDSERDLAARDISQTWTPVLEDIQSLRDLAEKRLAPGSQEPGVVRQRDRGKLTCRERIVSLLDKGSFQEVGSAAGFASYDEDGNIAAFTPANHVGGWGRIDGRAAVVCADDFTSRGGHADGAISNKSRHLDRLSLELQAPSIRLLDGSSGGGSVATMVPKQETASESEAKESSGAIKAGRPRVTGGGGSFLPAHLGSELYTEQLNTVPVVNVLLGSVVGIGAAKAVLGHFSVMVRDIAQLFVAGPPVVSHAMGYDISKEDLGGWHIHCTNGAVDNLAESEEEAMAITRHFLSYLPANVHQVPPILPSDPADPVDRREEELLTIIPRKRTATFDMRKVIRLLADKDTFFEIGPLWGTDQITGFIRCNGHPLGVIASDSRHENGGALTADGCDKLRRHLDLCDVFHIPILNLVDNPGFAVGLEHEIAGTIRKGAEWMVAFAQVKVPIFTVLARRSFGVAGNNYASPLASPSVRVAWPAADVGGIPPEGGIEAAYKRQLAEAEDPVALRAEIDARIESARGPLGPLNRFEIEEMIDPRDTRQLICQWCETAYQIVSQPNRLGPRALQFRP
jgi:acetyl/propionyl-CoA carboxylase alpha subunit/acetyl-CoA carboxylase carboxyltransferase component